MFKYSALSTSTAQPISPKSHDVTNEGARYQISQSRTFKRVTTERINYARACVLFQLKYEVSGRVRCAYQDSSRGISATLTVFESNGFVCILFSAFPVFYSQY